MLAELGWEKAGWSWTRFVVIWYGGGFLSGNERCSKWVCSWKKGNLIASPITSLIQCMYWLPNVRIKQCCAENNLAGNGNWSIWSWTSYRNFYSRKYILFCTCYKHAFLLLDYSHGQHFLLRTYSNSVTLIPGVVVSCSRTCLVPQYNVSYLSVR